MPIRDVPVRLRRVAIRTSRGRIGARSGGAAVASRPHSACYAPSLQLYFQPDGDVRACCLNLTYPLGNVGEEGLIEIWSGERRAELQQRLATDDYSRGCEKCAFEISSESRASSYPQSFEVKAAHLTDDPMTWAWPTFMEFNLSNACNLQCIQCNGELSSAIRIHREGRPPLGKIYGDAFFSDLRSFLPHLKEVQVAGGEPFLGAENYRLWDLIATEAPHISCGVVTNATQWNQRVEDVLARVPMHIALSIDGISKGTYEAIRVGADFDQVMANLDRFNEYSRQHRRRLHINHCLMIQNWHEFGDLLLFAEERGIVVSTSVVRYPHSASLAALPLADIEKVHASLCDQSDTVLGGLDLNASVWETELARIGAWVENHCDRIEQQTRAALTVRTILAFQRAGRGPFDDEAAHAALAAASVDGMVHLITVGSGNIIRSCSASAAEVVGRPAGALTGQLTAEVEAALAARYGDVTDSTVLSASDDQIDLSVTYGTTRFRTTLVAMRAGDGWAAEARILFAAIGDR